MMLLMLESGEGHAHLGFSQNRPSGGRARRTLQSGGSRPSLQSGGRAEPSNLGVSIWGYFFGGPPSAPEGHTAGAGSSRGSL